MVAVGIALGILIGVISGITVLFGMMVIIKAGWHLPANRIPQVVSLFSSVPILWTGGHWATTALLESVDFSTMLPSYAQSLLCTFCVIMFWPLCQLVIHVARLIASEDSSQNG